MREGAELDKKLDQYAVTAQGRGGHGRSLTEIAGYAAAAGASLGMAGTADAAIIYSGVQNLMVTIPNTAASTAANLSVDMDGAGNGFFASALFQAQLYTYTSIINGSAGVRPNGLAAFLGTNPNAADKLGSGAIISSGGVFNAAFGGNQRLQTATYFGFATGNTANPFTDGVSAFVGVKLGTGGTENYGWIRLILEDLGDNPAGTLGADGTNYFDKVTIVDWAYDDSGAAIAAGDTGAPALAAPQSLALLAWGAVGIRVLRRRKGGKAETS